IAYRNLAGTYNELKRNRWKIEKADKREDKGKIPRKTLEDAYIVFETSSESNPEAYHTIAFATREELNRIEKILGPDHYSLQDVYGKYGKSLQAVTENLMQYDTRRMIKQDEREAMITAFIQGSQQVFQLGERVDASSRQDEISSVPPKSTQERSEGLGQLAHLPNEPGSRDWKPEPIDWSKWDL
ncbi:MAG TPA: hypothetical protein VK553_06245, partial [Candidatus Nitrosopolaris rasttigaisensis]|nr:hypothetical protein [Candidatus Nitrosopolaris rasttigaisensis]